MKENKTSTAVEGNITGTNEIIDKSKENTFLTKEEIMFQVDEDGKAIPEEMEIEDYNKSIDDEIMLTTMELDNALTMYSSIKVSFKKMGKAFHDDINKFKNRKAELEKAKKPDLKEIGLVNESIKNKDDAIQKLYLENDMKLEAYTMKIKECRKDLDFLENKRDSEKILRRIKAIPCTVAEAYKYFHKKMWKNSNGEWQNPVDDEDNTYISQLLSDKIFEPKLTINEWDNVKSNMRLSMKEAIADISDFHMQSPKEILVNNRRSEKLKKLDGELEEQTNSNK